ncbi:adenosine receptor A1-like [Sminthopsis crassicaudata]|uniref:adenosine receptor A1-like n=1 Tax=Sminthopsis crassicaudata TaxID=9301 RepID=UPI003D69A236
MPPSISAFQATYIGIELLITLVSVPGNVLVIWTVKVNQALRDATFCFIVSLAVADVAVGALVIPLAILINIGPQTHFYTCLMVAYPVLQSSLYFKSHNKFCPGMAKNSPTENASDEPFYAWKNAGPESQKCPVEVDVEWCQALLRLIQGEGAMKLSAVRSGYEFKSNLI